MLDKHVMIESQQENVSSQGDVGTKQGLRKISLQGSVPLHEPNTSNPSPQGAYTRPIRILEGDATGVGNVNHFTYSHSVTAHTSDWLCCLKG